MPDLSLDARRLKALGHPVRLGIALRLAAEPETCACDFAEVSTLTTETLTPTMAAPEGSIMVPLRVARISCA